MGRLVAGSEPRSGWIGLLGRRTLRASERPDLAHWTPWMLQGATAGSPHLAPPLRSLALLASIERHVARAIGALVPCETRRRRASRSVRAATECEPRVAPGASREGRGAQGRQHRRRLARCVVAGGRSGAHGRGALACGSGGHRRASPVSEDVSLSVRQRAESFLLVAGSPARPSETAVFSRQKTPPPPLYSLTNCAFPPNRRGASPDVTGRRQRRLPIRPLPDPFCGGLSSVGVHGTLRGRGPAGDP